MSNPNWRDLERKPHEPAARADADFALICARLFNTPDGKEFLRLARAETFEKVLDAAVVQESALRAQEARRQFVRRIEALRDQGIAALEAKSKEQQSKP